MFLRIDKLQTELPAPEDRTQTPPRRFRNCWAANTARCPRSATTCSRASTSAARSKLRPFYSLVASITAEELGHVELVSNGVAMLANGPDKPTTMRRWAATSPARPTRR